MTHDELRSVVNAHTCRIGGLAYSFTVVGIATEKGRDPSVARHVVDVECVACGECSAGEEAAPRVRFLIGVSQLGDVRSLLTDALRNSLNERDSAGGRPRQTRSNGGAGTHSRAAAAIPPRMR